MGATESTTSELGGFRLFKVYHGSPAFEANLEVFFDFITDVNGTPMDSDQRTFVKKMQESEDLQARLVVYNIRTKSHRDVVVTPRRWEGTGLLGAVVRYDTLESADNQGIRVLDVFPNSPAAEAALTPMKDYLLGTTEVMFRDMDELAEVVGICQNKAMQIHVYNSDTESIRDVYLTPNSKWGGQGSIGADIRTGVLHRIPAPRRQHGLHKSALGGSEAAPSPAPIAAATTTLPEHSPSSPEITVADTAGALVENSSPVLASAAVNASAGSGSSSHAQRSAVVNGDEDFSEPAVSVAPLAATENSEVLSPEQVEQSPSHVEAHAHTSSTPAHGAAASATPIGQASEATSVQPGHVSPKSAASPVVAIAEPPSLIEAAVAQVRLAESAAAGGVAGEVRLPTAAFSELMPKLRARCGDPESPKRLTTPLDPTTPATKGLPAAPPCTPMNVVSASNLDPSVPLMSQITLRYGGCGEASELCAEELPDAPGIIYETNLGPILVAA